MNTLPTQLCLPDYTDELPPFLARVEGPQKWKYPQLHDGTLYPATKPTVSAHSAVPPHGAGLASHALPAPEPTTHGVSGSLSGTEPRPVLNLPEDPLERLALISTLPRGERIVPEEEKRRIARREQQAAKAHKRIARMLNNQVDKSAMPLVGKEALKRIKGD